VPEPALPSLPSWPDGKKFAFTIFDDPDSQTFETGVEVYSLLRDLGFRTTKGVWPTRGKREPSDHGMTCDDGPAYVEWLLGLKHAGFEIGYHNATLHTSCREETIAGIDRFQELFSHSPETMAQHYYCDENIYWGESRLTGIHRALYNVLTRGTNRNRYFGHVAGHPYYWGDVCKQRIRYVRNFVFADINTTAACPWMPYHDPARPLVNYWYASSEGSRLSTFLARLTEANQEKLEEEGGGCIMYTHFGHGFVENGKLNPQFRSAMERLARRNGWFAPVAQVLNRLGAGGERVITDAHRSRLERRWLLHKIRFGTA
jgi:hypothetical protein